MSIEKIQFAVLSIFVLYTIWYQYAIGEIPYFIIICGLIMAVLIIISILKKSVCIILKPTIHILIFIAYVAITGIFLTANRAQFNSMLINVIEYLIPALSIIIYVCNDRKKFFNFLRLLLISTFALALTVIFAGSSTNTNALTVGAYNTNTLSNILIFGIVAMMLLNLELKGNKSKLFVIIVMFILTIAQVECASRRGVIVHMLILLGYVQSLLKIKYKKNAVIKLTTALIVIIGITFFIMEFGYFSDKLVVLQRFQETGATASGDRYRRIYQYNAFQLFKSSPIVGVGFNGVASKIGVYSHSLYFELLACTGLIGLVIMLSFFIKYIYIFLISSKVNKFNESLNYVVQNRIMVWFCIAILISGIAVVYIYDMIFYLMIALIICVFNVNIKNYLNKP